MLYRLSYSLGTILPLPSLRANGFEDASAMEHLPAECRRERATEEPPPKMPERGLEPPPSYLDKNLNLARLPIPPLGRVRALIVPLVPRRASVHVAGLNSPAPV